MGSMHDTNHKGNVAEAAIAAAAVGLGIPVLRPQYEHGRYDLVFEINERFLRIQCKWAPRQEDVVIVRLSGYRLTTRGSVRSSYAIGEIDAVVGYCQELDQCYWLPIELAAGRRAIHLRLNPPRNGQMASINWAPDFHLEGAVAQLGRAPAWHAGGHGFESRQLHSSIQSGKKVVGAHDFRNRFGWYMERATAGEEFLVTRRGKPYVRLLPAREQLALDGPGPTGGPAGP
jgi:prevent-host-death family protein